MNTVYHFCSELPELGGSLICSCHGSNDIHTDKRVVTGKRTKRLGYDRIGERGRYRAHGALLLLQGGSHQRQSEEKEEATAQRLLR